MTSWGTDDPDDTSGERPGDDPQERGDATSGIPQPSAGGDWSYGEDAFIDDDDADEADGDRPAPISAYERPWRHPSELGPLVHHIETTTLPGRNLLAASAVIGLAFAVVLVRLVTAQGAGRTADVQNTASVRSQQVSLAGATSQGAAPVVIPTTSTVETVSAETAEIIVGSVVATTSATVASATTRVKNVASSALQSVAQRLRRSGVAVNDGSQLITTSKGLTEHVRIDVVLPDGDTRTGQVIEIHADSNLALVALDAPADTPTVAEVDTNESHYRVDVDGVAVPCKLALRSDGLVVTLDDDDQDSIAEGSPIMASDGDVIGLTTWSTGSPHVVQLAPVVDSFRQSAGDRQGVSSIPDTPPSSAATTTVPAPISTSLAPAAANEQPPLVTTAPVPAIASTTAVTVGPPGSGWFGILGVDTTGGVKVTGVLIGSPAQSAGFVPDSVIVSYGGSSITSIDQFAKLVRAGRAGSTVDVGYRLPGSETVVHVSVTLAPTT